MTASNNFWVHVQQPTVPHYRVGLFDRLFEHYQGQLRVSASPTVHQGPDSAKIKRDYLDLDHPCSTFWRKRAFWQHRMTPLTEDARGTVAVVSANPRYLSSLRFASLARRRGMGVVWWGHGWSPTSRAWTESIRRKLMSSADAVLLYSDAEADAWRPSLPATVKVLGAQNAIDQSAALRLRHHWTAERLTTFRRLHELEGRRLLLFCGRLRTQPETGLETLLRALVPVCAAEPDYLLAVIGDGEDRERLHVLAQMLNLSEHVRWLGAQYEESENAPWFLSASCFVYPGPIGLSILHAMGYGLPVITHHDRRRHNPEIVVLRNEWNGLEFQDGDVEDLARKILQLGADGSKRQELAQNAFSTAHVDFTLSGMTDRFCAAVDYARYSARHRT